MRENRGKMKILKTMMAVCLILNNFSGIGAIVKAATIEQNEINSSLNNNNIEEDMEVDDSVGENESEETIPTLPDNEGSEGDMNGEETPDLNLPGEDNAPSDEEQPPITEEEKPLEPSEDLEDSNEDQDDENLEEPEEELVPEEEEVQEELELDEEEVALLSLDSRSAGSGLIQLWQVVPDGQQSKEGKTTSEIMKALQCKPNHNLYPLSGGQSEHNTYVNSCYVDDAFYLGEDSNYYHIYLSGYEGKVPKSESHWFELDLNNDGKKVSYEIRTVAYYIPGASTYAINEIEEKAILDVPELNFYDETLDKYNDFDEMGIELYSTSTVQSPSYYANDNGTLYHYITSNVTKANSYSKVTAGKAPSWMSQGVKYYSYDGIYFYTNWRNIRVNGQGAVNQNNPFYNYYQYLPFRSKSNYAANIFNNYTNSNGGAGGKLVNTGQYFYAVQDKYGINGALQYAMGIHESGWGKSSLSMDKNNLFGMNATDNNPYGNGTSFPSVEAGINYHADRYLSWGYTDPIDDWRYFGSHVGNKGSGMNVKYASDPFWGEKIAGWYYRFDSASGLRDYDYYTIGIKQSNAVVDVKSQANSGSSTLYQTKNKKSNLRIPNYPVLITGEQNGYYKIKTDTPVNGNGDAQYNATYFWGNTYGYIPQSSVFLTNHRSFPDPFDAGNMLNHVDGISYDGQQIRIDGWAFINGLDMNNKDSFTTSILVKNSNNQVIQRFIMTPTYSTDLSEWKGLPLNYARYSGVIDLSSLAVGDYTFEVEIETSHFIQQMNLTSNFYLPTQTGYGKGNKQIISMTDAHGPLKLRVSGLDQVTHADNVDVQSNGNLYIYGWSTLDGLNMNQSSNFERYIVIKNASGQEVKREKVTALYDKGLSDWNKQPQDYARFKVNIPIKDLALGTYSIYVELKTSEYTKETLLQSNYHLTEVKTGLAGKSYTRQNSKAQSAVQLRVSELNQVTHADNVDVQSNGDLYIYGWSTLDGLNMNQSSNFERYIVIKNASGQEVKRKKVTAIYDKGLSDWNKQPQDYARFKVNIPIKDLAIGTYSIYVELKTSEYTKETLLQSNYHLTEVKTGLAGKSYTRQNSKAQSAVQLRVSELDQVTHVDTFEMKAEGTLYIYGWTTLDGLNMNKQGNFERSIVVKNSNGQEVQRVLTTPVYSTDLSDWNKQPQDYARFNASIDLKTINEGSYDIYVELKTSDYTKQTKLSSNYAVSQKSRVMYGQNYITKNSGAGTAMQLVVENIQQETHIDSYSIQDDGILSLYGWSTLEGMDMNNDTIFSRELLIVDQSGKEIKRATVISQYATDLSDWNKKPQNYARFKVNIAINDLPKGEYKLALTLQTSEFIKNNELKSNYKFNMNSTTLNGKTFSLYNTGEGTVLQLKVQ